MKQKTSSSVIDVSDISDDTAKFGSRLLKDEESVFSQNAWDHVEWDEEQDQYAHERVKKMNQPPLYDNGLEKYYAQPAEYWNQFYQKNENRFFKDRHWLRIEFPELFQTADANAGSKKVFEVGCGAGNTMFPLLEQSKNPNLFVYAADYSSTAVQVVQNSDNYDTTRSLAFVWDLASSEIPDSIQPGSLDIIVLIFVLSALTPEQWDQAITNMHKMLKPGGMVLFRDYGRHDLAQLRFKEKRLLKENFYIRGDGTRVYFFTSEEVAALFSSSGLHGTEPRFEVEQNAVDRRLIVNRGRKIKMYRVWLQGKFRKL
ncbi:S-adenosyl-L-methionine-dependent methyltransferase [Spinellus fusiger]|nr:S-adenosyl-L-methionine-dependent methyltransferase [Spinellus fusiger]